ncbi:MAG: flagellar hook-length control protein FliK [Pseudomonadota bacterium]
MNVAPLPEAPIAVDAPRRSPQSSTGDGFSKEVEAQSSARRPSARENDGAASNSAPDDEPAPDSDGPPTDAAPAAVIAASSESIVQQPDPDLALVEDGQAQPTAPALTDPETTAPTLQDVDAIAFNDTPQEPAPLVAEAETPQPPATTPPQDAIDANLTTAAPTAAPEVAAAPANDDIQTVSAIPSAIDSGQDADSLDGQALKKDPQTAIQRSSIAIDQPAVNDAQPSDDVQSGVDSAPETELVGALEPAADGEITLTAETKPALETTSNLEPKPASEAQAALEIENSAVPDQDGALSAAATEPRAEAAGAERAAAPRQGLLAASAASQIAAAIQINPAQDEVRIELDPPELGALQIRMQFSEQGTLFAQLSIENDATRQLMKMNEADLRQALADAGFPDAQLDFSESGGREAGDGGAPSQNEPSSDSIAALAPEEMNAAAKLGVRTDRGVDIRV